MRETPLSNCERDFIRSAIADKKRLDGRQPYDYRKIKITFGVDRGSCQVEIGETRVLAQVSSEITTPKQTRPSDGMLFINVELSPMASPGFEVGRLSEFGVEINRLLERCLKESRCVDTESLCIISGEKVWQIRVDVHVLNHDGNLIDCSSIAAISALAHFRRPDVTVDGNEVKIHPVEEKDPLPLSVHHMPICVTFAFYEQGKYLLVDPTDKEEKVMDGKMVVGMNKHREICSLQVTGQMLLLKDQVLRCSNIAVVKVTEITELIHNALDNDRQARSAGEKFGFAESLVVDTVKSNQMESEVIEISENEEEIPSPLQNGNGESEMNELKDKETSVKILDKGVGSIGEGGPSAWEVDNEMEQEVADEIHTINKSDRSAEGNSRLSGNHGDDSEEEATCTLSKDDLHNPTQLQEKLGKQIKEIRLAANMENKEGKEKEKSKKKKKKKGKT